MFYVKKNSEVDTEHTDADRIVARGTLQTSKLEIPAHAALAVHVSTPPLRRPRTRDPPAVATRFHLVHTAYQTRASRV